MIFISPLWFRISFLYQARLVLRSFNISSDYQRNFLILIKELFRIANPICCGCITEAVSYTAFFFVNGNTIGAQRSNGCYNKQTDIITPLFWIQKNYQLSLLPPPPEDPPPKPPPMSEPNDESDDGLVDGSELEDGM